MMCTRLCCTILLCALLSVATAQAPGDEDSICIAISAVITPPVFPAYAKILMDSFNYVNLIPVLNPSSGPWQQLDNDNSTDPVTGVAARWFQSDSNACRATMSVCGFVFGPQNNWLITQYISRVVNGTRLPQVSVQVEFELTGCNSGCQRSFILNVWETSTVDRAAARNTSNYQLINRVAPDDATGLISQNQTREINFNTEEDGFYIAIRDETTCIAVSRVIVFYNVCPQDVLGLVVYPETIAPRQGRQSSLIDVTTVCVPGASPENGVAPKLTCAQGGTWNSVTGLGCQCNSGFAEAEDGLSCIEGCMAGLYLSLSSQSECRSCPEKSMSKVSGLSECPCVQDYYRAPGEVDLPCTQPPGPPTNVRVVSINSTSIFLEWDPPELTGGRNDISYILWYETEEGSRMQAGPFFQTKGSITGLDPNTRYKFSVSAENGVSMFAPTSTQDDRLVEVLNQFSGNNTGLIAGVVVGLLLIIVIAIILILLFIGLLIYQRRTGSSKGHLIESHPVVPIAIKGRRTYVDPGTYSTIDDAIEAFAKEIELKHLKLTTELGAGEFGDVYRGEWNQELQDQNQKKKKNKNKNKPIDVAVKTLRHGSSTKMRNDFLNEASIMGQFQHDHVIKLYGVVTKVDPAMIVMEFMENGSLYSYLRKNDEKFNTQRLLEMTRGVCSGMEYLATVGYVHRDLAARNILLDNDEVCKVADFGLSREVIDDEYNVQKGGKIPVRWTAPEAIYRRKFTSSSDVWSFGVLMWEVMSYAQHPYDDWDNQRVLDELDAGYRLENPYGCPDSIYEVMLDCWNSELSRRPTFGEILKRLDLLLNMESPPKRPPKNRNRNSGNPSVANPLQCKSVNDWLTSVKMERYIPVFQKEGVTTVNQIVHLNETDLRGMGINLAGHLHRLTQSIDTGHMDLKRTSTMGNTN